MLRSSVTPEVPSPGVILRWTVLLVVIIGVGSVALSGPAVAADRCSDYPIQQLDLQSNNETPLSAIAITADTTLADTDTIGNNPGEPYFRVEIDGAEIGYTDVVNRSANFNETLQIPQTEVNSLDAGQHTVTVGLWDKDGDTIDETTLGVDDSICEETATIQVEDPVTSQISTAEIVQRQDPDNDGYATAFTLDVQATTLLPDSDLAGDNPGEPYFLIRVNGTVVHITDIVPRGENRTYQIELASEDLQNISQGEYDLTVELWDKDGDEIDSTDFGNDDRIDMVTGSVRIDQPITIRTSRDTTVAGSPVAVQLSGEPDREIVWEVSEQPPGSDVSLQTEYKHTVSFRPTVPGEYRIIATPDGLSVSKSVTVSVSGEQELTLLRRYAPRIHYDAREEYVPTRYEAFIYNARLQQFGAENIPNPTVFDLQGKAGWELELKGGPDDYAEYQEEYPPTVYGSVHRDVTFRGSSYTAITYWLFYTYDPKQPDSIGELFAHQSDLETVTLLLQDGSPKWVGASQHYGGELRRWAETPTNGTHLNLYPALGAHSNYLRNTQNYGGVGIPMQQQFIFKESTNTSLALGFELEEYIETLGYTDRTGDDVRYTNDGGGDETYQLVPLTGTEIWAAYRGSLNPNNESGAPPFQRERWSNPGQWMEETLPSDETQFDVNLTDGELSTSPETIESTLQVVNRGPKPHPVWVVVEAKPVSASWEDPLAVTLYEKPVFVGVGERKEVDIQTTPPTQAGEWEVRVRLTSYPPSVVESVQLLGELTAADTITVETPTPTPTPTPSPTPPATESPSPSEESDPPTSQPTNEGPGTPEGTDSSPTVPGFGIPAVVVAFVLFGLLRRHR